MQLASRGQTRYALTTVLSLALLLSLTITESGCGGSPSAAAAPPPPTKSLTSISISPTAPTVALGQSQQLTASGVFSDGSRQDMTKTVTWASAQPSVASINRSGLASGKLVGITKLTATSGSVTASVTLTVGAAALVSIAVSPQSPSVPKGGTQQLSALGTFSDGSQKTITDSATWSVRPTSVATVSTTGLVTAQAVGSATVSADLDSIRGTNPLTVSAATLVSIAVSPQSPSVPKGETQQLSAVGTFSDGSQKTITDSATWSVLPTGVATVSATGLVNGQAVGSATVSADLDSIRGSDPLTVSAATLVSIAVSPRSPSIPKGETQQLTAVATFSDGSQKTITNSATWSIAPTGIATVSPTGLLTAQAEGSATVTAASATVQASDPLTVSLPILVSIAVAPANSSIMLGTTEQLIATGTFSDGSTQDLTNSAAWSSANSSTASIGPAGLAAANSVGSTSISAASADLAGSTALTVEPQLLLTYFSQANNPATNMDATVYVTNVGMTNSSLCAMVYVFDTQQEMTECCACSASPDDLRTLSINNNLTNQPATGVAPAVGVVEIVSASSSSQACNASSSPPGGELRAWSTHIQVVDTSTFALTEAPFEVVPLTPTHASQLQSQCGFLMEETHGICTCGAGD